MKQINLYEAVSLKRIDDYLKHIINIADPDRIAFTKNKFR